MLKKYKYLALFLLIPLLIGVPVASVFGLEITYPNVPGAPAGGPQAGGTDLAKYIVYVFIFAVGVAGIVGVISLVIAGFQFLLSSADPELRSSARDRIFGSIFGIVLLMFSFILLRTINPDLITPEDPYSSLRDGIYYAGVDPTTNEIVYQAASREMANTSMLPAPFTSLVYICNSNPGETLLVWVYDKSNYEFSRTGGIATTLSIPCDNDGTAIRIRDPILSYYTEYEDIGVYFYLTPNCTGVATSIQEGSGDIHNFDNDFDSDQTVRSMKIISGGQLDVNTVVLTKDYNFGGECSEPIIQPAESSGCFPIPTDRDGNEFNPYSAHILKQAQWYPANNEVYLYSTNYYAHLDSNDIGYHYTYPAEGQGGNLNTLMYSQGEVWSDRVPPASECNTNDPLGTCVNYVDSSVGFNKIFYSEDENINRACKIFPEGKIDNSDTNNPDHTNVEFEELVGYGKEVYRMDIIPFPY